MDALAALQAGAIFARDYRIVKPLAQGGMGAVYVAEQLSTSKLRALKLMHPQLAANQKSRERFIFEAQAASQIDSDHVVEVLAAGVDPETGVPWLSMELLKGQTLADLVEQRGPLPVSDVREVVRQFGHAFEQAHDLGLVHRDLKPENLFVAVPRRSDVPFTIKVLDFGIARWTQEVQDGMKNSQVIGSPFWMAPEQLELGGMLFPSTDVWAVGLIVFYLLTGRIYWRAANDENATITMMVLELVTSVLEPASVRAASLGFAAPLPEGFDDWFAMCVERDPVGRFPTARECVSELLALLPSGAATISATGGAPAPASPTSSLQERLTSALAPPASVPAPSTEPELEFSTQSQQIDATAALPAPPVATNDMLRDLLEAQVRSTEDPKQRHEIALRMAKVFEVNSSNFAQAVYAYQRALDFDASSPAALQGLTDLYRTAQQWDDLARVLRHTLDVARVRLTPTALRDRTAELAVVLEEKLAKHDEAGPLWRTLAEENPHDERALDGALRALERSTAWSDAASLLERAASSDKAEPARRAKRFRQLSDVYSTHLGQLDIALAKLEEAAKLAPDPAADSARRAALRANASRKADALTDCRSALEHDPANLDALAVLHKLYDDAGALDRAWCVAHAAVVVHGERAPAALQSYARERRGERPSNVLGRLEGPDGLRPLAHPDLAPQHLKLALAMGPLARRLRTKALRDAGLDPRELLDPGRAAGALMRTGLPLFRTLLAAGSTLDIPTTPSLYLRRKDSTPLRHLATDPPASSAGEAWVTSVDAATLQFGVWRHAAYYRHELHLRTLLGSSDELASWSYAAARLLDEGAAPAPAPYAPLAEQIYTALAANPTDAARVRRGLEGGTATLDAAQAEAFVRGIDCTAARVGLLFAGDLGVAHSAVRAQPDAGGAGAPLGQELADDLLRFAVSDAYFELRERFELTGRAKG